MKAFRLGTFCVPAVSCGAFSGVVWALAVGCSSTPAPEAPSSPSPSEILAEGGDSSSFDAGVSAIGNGDFESARKIFSQLVTDEAGNAQAHFYLGVAEQ